ncbi:MAG TPA: peptide MFS transporter, partial [Anaeromyxobacteraceae bacterium]|nr:peptide MFS transporter [Anaeromyxobacteraceae bacterium]
LVNGLHWDTPRAASLYGTYTMLVYLTPLAGGFLADRCLGTRQALVLGGLVIASGHFCLAFPGQAAFYLGLLLIIVGTGLFKPNASTMVGQLYPDGDPRRDSGFTIFYMGVNAGAALGPLACGVLAASVGWHAGFAAAGVGMLVGLLVNVWGRDRYLRGIGFRPEPHRSASEPPASVPGNARVVPGSLLGAAAGGLLAVLLGGTSALTVAFLAAVGAVMTFTVLGTQGEERRRVLALFLTAFFVVFFWAAYEQAGSSMNLFADKYTDLSVAGFEVPASLLQSVNPVLILVFAPAFAGLWNALAKVGREPATPLKMVLGLFLLGVGFVFLVVGGGRADAGVRVSPLWLVAAYAFHTLGELCLSPVGLSYVSKISPPRFAALLMGSFFLANAAANKLAGALATFTPVPGESHPLASGLKGVLQRVSSTNRGFYSIFVASSFAAALLMLLFVPLLRRLTSGVRA